MNINLSPRLCTVLLVLLFGLQPCWAAAVVLDFDGDGKTDPVVLRVENGKWFWYILGSNDGYMAAQFGQDVVGNTTDVFVPADYDGDGKCDIAVFRRHVTDEGQSYFFIYYSESNTVGVIPWGVRYDQAVPQDYDGDGKVDVAVYRGTESIYYIQQSRDGFRAAPWGGGTPINGDFDGDGKADLAVYRRDDSTLQAYITFYIKHSSDGTWTGEQFGYAQADFVVPGDFDGDGKTDIAVWRGATEYGNGVWYWHRSSDGKYDQMRWGVTSAKDRAVPGDYDGDGTTDLAVFRRGVQPQGYFYINQSSNGYSAIPWGAPFDTPITQFK